MVIHTLNDQASIDQVFKENRCFPASEKDTVVKQLDSGKRLLLCRKLSTLNHGMYNQLQSTLYHYA
jgi:hypothetical protein